MIEKKKETIVNYLNNMKLFKYISLLNDLFIYFYRLQESFFIHFFFFFGFLTCLCPFFGFSI